MRTGAPGMAALAALMAIAAGCARAPAPDAAPAEGSSAAATVALLVEGSAFRTTGPRDQVALLVATAAGLPVQSLAREPSVDGVLAPVAKRVAREPGGARATYRSPACRKSGRSVATALATRADALYRVRLAAARSTRPATDADREDLGARDGMLAGVLGARGDTVFETRLDGAIERTTFAGAPATARQPIRWVVRALGRAASPPPLDVRDAVAHALAALPPAAAPRWDAVARSFVGGGCPLLAYAIADARVHEVPVKRRLRAAALAAMSSQTAAGPTSPLAAADAPQDPEPTGDPGPHTEPAAAPSEPAPTCATLCGLHMVELCNNDRTLWSQHGSRWESTRCGVRRAETFLEECYRMHWLSGTYERACMEPCESTSEGRERLETLLRRAGCLRGGA